MVLDRNYSSSSMVGYRDLPYFAQDIDLIWQDGSFIIQVIRTALEPSSDSWWEMLLCSNVSIYRICKPKNRGELAKMPDGASQFSAIAILVKTDTTLNYSFRG